MNWYVYIVKCSDKSLYTGITINLKRRISQHNNKMGSKSVMGKLPVQLIYKEIYNNKIEALKRENEIKSWTRLEKLQLVKGR